MACTAGKPSLRLVVTSVAGPIPGFPYDDDQPLVLLADYPTGRYSVSG